MSTTSSLTASIQNVPTAPQPHESKSPAPDARNPRANSSVDVVSISSEANVLKKYDDANAQTAQSATELSARDKMIGAVANQLGQMKETLHGIIKNFPPFPIDSQERQDLLMSYNGLRKQIDRLTFPPPIDAAHNRKGWLWDDMFKRDLTRVMPPELERRASDKAVQEASDQVSVAQNALSRIQQQQQTPQ